MPELDGTAVTLLVGLISTLGVILVGKIKASSDREQSSGPEWQRFNDNVQKWTSGQLEARDREIEALKSDRDADRKKLDHLNGVVGELQVDLSDAETRNSAFAGHVHDWRAVFHDERHRWPRVPFTLRDTLDDD